MGASQENRSRRRHQLVLGVVAAASIATAACGGSTPTPNAQTPDTGSKGSAPADVGRDIQDEGAPEEGGKLVVGVTAETDGWNPAYAQWAESGHIVASSMFEPLYVYDKDLNLVPWLAESATPSEDDTVWTIKLRPGIKFHDGTDLDAAAAVRSMDTGFTKGLASIAVKGLVEKVERVDDLSLKFTLQTKWASFLHLMAGQNGTAAGSAMFDAEDNGTANPIGTGAYKFDDWIPDSSLRVSKNDNYWGGPCALPDPGEAVKKMCTDAGIPLGQKNGPFLSSIEFRPIPDEQQRVSALEAGDIDLALTKTPRSLGQTEGEFQQITDMRSEKNFVQLNTAKAPFDNLHARKAVAYAVDQTKVASAVSPDIKLEFDTSPFSASTKWGLPAGETGALGYDPEAAKQELEAYKKDTGNATLEFELFGEPDVDSATVVQALQQAWSELGIVVSVTTADQATAINTMVAGQFQAAQIHNYTYPDPDSQNFFFSAATAEPPLIINWSQFSNDVTEEALTTGRESSDFATRKAAYDRLVKERNANVTEVWLYDTPYALLAADNVRGMNPLRALRWGTYLPKPYLTNVWVDRP